MTPAEWFLEMDSHVSERGIAGTNISENRQEELEEWAASVRAKRKKQNDKP